MCLLCYLRGDSEQETIKNRDGRDGSKAFRLSGGKTETG